jgi:hypothetical protein
MCSLAEIGLLNGGVLSSSRLLVCTLYVTTIDKINFIHFSGAGLIFSGIS